MNVGLTPEELANFKKALHALCSSFGVFLKKQSERRESPSTKVYYYEVEISAKVTPDKIHNLVE